jgi:hypothetical protein
MPVGRGKDQDGRTVAAADFRFGDAGRLLDGFDLDALPFIVEFMQLRGDHQGLVLVVDGKQARAETGIADAAAGIDARADQVTEMIRVQRAGETSGERQ